MMNERKVDHLANNELFPASDLPSKPKELRSSNKPAALAGKSVLSGKKTSGGAALPPESSSGPKASPLSEKEIVTSEKKIQSLNKEIVSSAKNPVSSEKDIVPLVKDTVSSGKDTVSSGKDTVSSGKDTVSSGKDTVSSAKNTSADPLPVGTRLKKAREAQGLSLDIVHDGTKIPMDALRAIEEGYSVRTLSPFYYKGFVKIYGDFLGVDITDIMTGAEASRSRNRREDADDERSFFFRDWFAKSFNVAKVQQILSFLFLLVFLFLLFKLITFIFHRPRPAVSTSVESAAAPLRVSEPAPLPRPRVVAPPPEPVEVVRIDPSRAVEPAPVAPVDVRPAMVPAPVAAPAPRQVKNVTLVVRARTDSWLRVAVDGEVVFQSTLGTGSVKTWLADEQIEISGRNLEQLEMELNGKMIGALGRRQRGAKSILIKEDGLTVLQ